jgi:hypothetical protein
VQRKLDNSVGSCLDGGPIHFHSTSMLVCGWGDGVVLLQRLASRACVSPQTSCLVVLVRECCNFKAELSVVPVTFESCVLASN